MWSLSRAADQRRSLGLVYLTWTTLFVSVAIRIPGRLDPNCAFCTLCVLPPIRLLEDEDRNDRDQCHTRHDQTVLIDFSLYDFNAVPSEPRQSDGQKLSLRPRTDISAFPKMLKNLFCYGYQDSPENRSHCFCFTKATAAPCCVEPLFALFCLAK